MHLDNIVCTHESTLSTQKWKDEVNNEVRRAYANSALTKIQLGR